MLATYIYFQEAFDSVYCESLCEILRFRGMPAKSVEVYWIKTTTQDFRGTLEEHGD